MIILLCKYFYSQSRKGLGQGRNWTNMDGFGHPYRQFSSPYLILSLGEKMPKTRQLFLHKHRLSIHTGYVTEIMDWVDRLCHFTKLHESGQLRAVPLETDEVSGGLLIFS